MKQVIILSIEPKDYGQGLDPAEERKLRRRVVKAFPGQEVLVLPSYAHISGITLPDETSTEKSAQ